MTVSPIPTFKHRDTVVTLEDQDIFVEEFETTIDHLADNTVGEMNAVVVEVNNSRDEAIQAKDDTNTLKSETQTIKDSAVSETTAIKDSAQTAADTALATANNKGSWNLLTGALNIPASVNHAGAVWVLNVDLADVTASEPSDTNADWQVTSTALIKKPTIITPTSGTTDFIGEVVASAYETSENYNGSQDVAYWEASTTIDFLNIVDSSSVGNLTTWTPSIGLPLTTIYVRVRYGSDNHLSPWSDTINFTTPNVTISAPTVSVTGEPTDVGETPTISGSAFTVIGGSDTHTTTDYQIYEGSTLKWESLADTELLSKTVPAGILEVSTEYIFKMKYNGATYTGSYGSKTATTKSAFELTIGTAGSQGFGVAPCYDDMTSLGLLALAGTEDPTSPQYGNYQQTIGLSIMVHVPRFFYRIGHPDSPQFATYGANAIDIVGTDVYATEAEANTAGYKMPRCFINGGVEKNGVFIDKYINSKYNNDRGVSVFGANPIGLTTSASYNPSSTMTGCTGILADAVTLARARGTGYANMTTFAWGMLAILQVAHAQASTSDTYNAWYDATGNTNYPKGCNNNALSDVDDSSVTYAASPDTAAKPLAGATANFAKTTHNGQECGIADLNGSMFEVPMGITNAGTSATDSTAVTNDNIFVLKESVDVTTLTGGWNSATDVWGDTTHMNSLYDSVTSSHALGSTTGAVYWGNGGNGVFSDDERLCGFIPKDNNSTDATGTNQFGTDQMYRHNHANMVARCGGYWVYAAYAGVFCRTFHGYRSYSNSYGSFRCLAYLP